MKKICVFTGTRAEYGLLKSLMGHIQADTELELQTLVSGMHLSPEFGLTYREIEQDGFRIDERVETLMSSDTPVGLSKSTGLGLIGLSEALGRLRPDLLVLLGDRYEAMAAGIAAMMACIPIAHLHGGEATFGLIDEAIRHAVTKMSHLHFTATEVYRRRVIQLGEHPARVFNVGAIGLDNLKRLTLLDRAETEAAIGRSFGVRNVLVTFHPVTLEQATAAAQFENLLSAIDLVSPVQVIFTKANADTDGRVINTMIDDYVAANSDHAAAFVSLGQLRYLSVMRQVDAVVGNSSSGIIEAPSLGVPSINIGARQQGRIRAASVIDCDPAVEDIVAALKKAFTNTFKKMATTVDNPYEGQNTSQRIKEIIKETDFSGVRKSFYDIPIDILEQRHEKCQEGNGKPPDHHS